MSLETPFVTYYECLSNEVLTFLRDNNIEKEFIQEYYIFNCINTFSSYTRTKTIIPNNRIKELHKNYDSIESNLTFMQKIYLKISAFDYYLGVLFFKAWMVYKSIK